MAEQVNLPGYQIKNTIGTGSIGTVFMAENAKKNKLAVKIIRKTPFLDDKFLEILLKSTDLIREISQNDIYRIVKIHDAGIKNDFLFIIADFFKNGSLENLIEKNSMNFIEKLQFLYELADSLGKIHSIGLIHEDLKPANILIGDTFKPYLNDFYQAADNTFGTKTYSGVKGTPLYMSPEQLAGKFINKSSDIYSFGVIASELLGGQIPYPPHLLGGMKEMITLVNAGNIIQPGMLNRQIDSDLNTILMNTLRLDPLERYGDMSIVAEDLKEYMGESPRKLSFINKLKKIF